MRIDSHDRFDDLADFDPVTGRLLEFSRTAENAPELGPVEGHYARLSGTIAVLYRLGSALWLRIDNEARNVDQAGIEVRWLSARGRSTLEILEDGAFVAGVQYLPGSGGGAGDPTPFAESEDWDFGLFIKNVLGNSGRRARIYDGAP